MVFSNDTWPEAYRGNRSLNSISYTSLPPMNYSITLYTSGSWISTGENAHAAAATSRRPSVCMYTIFINRLIRNLFSKRLCTRNNPFSVVKPVFLGPPQRGFRWLSRRSRRRRRRKKNKLQKIATDGYPHLSCTPPTGNAFELQCHNSLMTIFRTP